MLFRTFLKEKSLKNHEELLFFRFFVKRPAEQKCCSRLKYFDLLDAMILFWMYTSHGMIRGIKKAVRMFWFWLGSSLNFEFKIFCQEKGLKMAVFGPISHQTIKNLACSLGASYTKLRFFWIYTPKASIISQLILY